jgi:hypothetical protein
VVATENPRARCPGCLHTSLVGARRGIGDLPALQTCRRCIVVSVSRRRREWGVRSAEIEDIQAVPEKRRRLLEQPTQRLPRDPVPSVPKWPLSTATALVRVAVGMR